MTQLTVAQAVDFLQNLSQVDRGCHHCFNIAFKAVYGVFGDSAVWKAAAEIAFPAEEPSG